MSADRLHRRLLRASLLVGAGVGCAGFGCVLFPESNLGGGLGLVGGLLASVGVVVILVTLIAWCIGARE